MFGQLPLQHRGKIVNFDEQTVLIGIFDPHLCQSVLLTLDIWYSRHFWEQIKVGLAKKILTIWRNDKRLKHEWFSENFDSCCDLNQNSTLSHWSNVVLYVIVRQDRLNIVHKTLSSCPSKTRYDVVTTQWQWQCQGGRTRKKDWLNSKCDMFDEVTGDGDRPAVWIPGWVSKLVSTKDGWARPIIVQIYGKLQPLVKDSIHPFYWIILLL